MLGDRSPAIFGDVLSGAFYMLSSVFQSTWRDNGTQSVLGCDYASCFPNVALFNPYRSHCPNMYHNLGLLRVYCNSIAHPQHGH